eukprot:403357450
MNENLYCGKCKKIFNTRKRLPIELQCKTKICKFRNACLKCVKKHILPSKQQNGTFKCCYSEQHTIASDFIFENDEQIFAQVEGRDHLTIKCMEHTNAYIEHYCHPCKKLICIKCYPSHLEHIKDQGGSSEFTPEKLHSYLLFVRPELENIYSEIRLSLKIFNKALGREKDYFGDEIIDRVGKSYDLLKNIVHDRDIKKLHLHQHNQKISSSDPQSQTTLGNEEELKSDKDIDSQLHQQALNQIRSIEFKQEYWFDKLEKIRVQQQTFIDQVTLGRQEQTEEFLNLKEALENKVKTSIEQKFASAKEQIDKDVNALVSLINSTKFEQNKNIEVSQNDLTNAFEEFKVHTSNNLQERLEAFDNALKITNQNLNTIEQNCQQIFDFKDDHTQQLKQLYSQLHQSVNDLTQFKLTTKTQYDEQFVNIKEQIDNISTVNDELTKEVKNLTDLKLDNSVFQELEVKLQRTIDELQLKIESNFQQSVDEIDFKLNQQDQQREEYNKETQSQVVTIDIMKQTKELNIDTQQLSEIQLKDIVREEQKLNQIEEVKQQKSDMIQQNISSIVQVPSVEECKKLSDQDKKKLFRDLVKQEINQIEHSLISSNISNYSTKQFQLLFRGSIDGFKASKFHEKCDGKQPTVTFIQSEYGLVFGGFTSIPWTSNHQYYRDPTAFVFSLSKRSIHKQYRNQDKAVLHHKNRMCVFGIDISIDDDCDKNSKTWSSLGWTYEPPTGYKKGSDEAKSYLAGQQYFKVLEIEVYSLQ